MLLRDLRISLKLLVILLVAVLGIIAAEAFNLVQLRENLLLDRQAKTRSLTDSAWSLVAYYAGLATSGKMSTEQAQAAALLAVRSLRYDGEEYFFIGDDQMHLLANAYNVKNEGKDASQFKDSDGKYYFPEFVEKSANGKSGFVYYTRERPGGTVRVPKLTYVRGFPQWHWFVATGIYIYDVDDIFWQQARSSALATAAILLAVLAAVFGIGRVITRPIRSLTRRMTALAAGDHDISIDQVRRGDEIGAMAKAVQVFKDNAIAVKRLQSERDEATSRAQREKKQAMEALAQRFEHSVRAIADVVSSAATEMQSTAQSMSATADQTRQQAMTVATASEQASNNVQTVATAADELSSSIAEIIRQMTRATAIVGKAAEEGQRTNATVEGLATAARQIGQVVDLINEIASQTNLLALNATIEAARAGDAGRGFAVVASEVKSLASQTAKATDDIRSQITAIQAETNQAVEAIRGICGTIADVSEISTSITSAVEEQNSATQEIARNVQQVAQGTGEATRNIASVTDAAGETGAAATQVLNSARELARNAETLRAEVGAFLGAMRAA
jgi:methyl-accepting chemotaxis protein